MTSPIKSLFRFLILSALITVFGSIVFAAPVKEPGTDTRPRVPAAIMDADNTNLDAPRSVETIDELNVAVTIGNGTSTARYPIHEYYWFSRSQAIYTASEIGQAGLITYLRWYPTNARTWQNTGGSNVVKIYLATTASSSVNAQPYSTTGMTLVYQNNNYTGSPNAFAWQDFDITDFPYNGTDNLMVVTEVDLGGYSTPAVGEGFRYTVTGANRFQYWEQDSVPPVSNGIVTLNRPNIQFEFSTTAPVSPTIGSPTNGATNVSVNSSVTWSTGANTNNADVYFSSNQNSVSFLDTTTRVLSAVPTTTTSYTPGAPLSAGITYYWRVVARNTSTSEVSPGPVWSFTTSSPPLTGTKTIGGLNPNYATFTDAVNALIAYGVGTGGVTFNVRTGTYAERIVIPAITGASSTNHVVFQKESGAVTLATNGTSGTSDAFVKLYGADYIEFHGIDLLDLGSSDNDYVDYGFYITNQSVTNGSSGNIITNSSITLHRANLSSRAIYQQTANAPSGQTGANNDNHYLDIKISNCTSAVTVAGNSSYPDSVVEFGSTSRDPAYLNRFTVGSGGIDDDIGNVGSNYGMLIQNVRRALVHDCDVLNLFTTASGSTIYGIYLSGTIGINEVDGNRVKNLRNESGSSVANGLMGGIYLNSQSGSGNEIHCFNNMITGFNYPRTVETTSMYLVGINSSGTSGLCYVDFNSILLNPSTNGSTSACVILTNATTLRNNIFYNATPNQFNAKHYSVYVSGAGIPTSNNNVFYSPNFYGSNFAYQSSADKLGFEDWRNATGQDANSWEGNPRFFNEATGDLHLQTGVITNASNGGTPVGWVTTDLEGTTRNGVAPDIGADEGNFSSITPLNGIKTIGGTNPTYTTITDAIDALAKYGIGAGGVTFSVRSGTYSGPLTIPYLPDASDRTPAIFQKESGTVTVTNAGTQGTSDAMLRLFGCDYVTFDGIDFTDSGSSASDYVEYGVWVGGSSGRKGATNNTIKNSTITLHRANSSSYAVYQYSYYTPIVSSATNNTNHYLNLKITNCRYGVYLNGNNSYSDFNTEIGSTSNDLAFAGRFTIGSGGLDDIGGNNTPFGISLYYQNSARVHDCDITNLYVNASGNSVYGIYGNFVYGVTTITGNRIYNLRQTLSSASTTGSLYGIQLSTGDEVRVNNNFISGFSHGRTSEINTNYVFGIYSSGISNFYCDYNTFQLGAGIPCVNSMAMYLSGGTQYIRNNIIASEVPNQVSSKHYGIYFSSGTFSQSNNNLFFMPNTANGFAGYYSSDYHTLDDWQLATGKDLNSVQGDPRFRDEVNNDLRITPGVYTPVNNAGVAVSQVTTDVSGNSRNGSTPDIGPEEGNFVSSSPLTGTKTIGGVSPNYTTFTAAVNDLQLYGVGNGGVIFNVRPGTYNEQVNINPINGTSASNLVTFHPESGPVTISSFGTAGSTDAIVKFNGCDWVIFDGISVVDLGTSSSNYSEYGYWITNYAGANGATNNTIKNATITMNRLATGSYAIYQNPTFAPTVQTGANNSNHYLNLKITNVRNGVYLAGNSSYRDQNCEIGSTTSNVSDVTRFIIGTGGGDDIGGASSSNFGVYLSYQEVIRVHDIDVSNVFTSTYNNSVYGIYTTNTYGVNEFSDNRIYNIHNSSGDANATGSIYGAYLNAVSGNDIRFFNNTISGCNHPRTTETSTMYLYGVYANGGNIYLDYNNILINPNNAGASNTCFFNSTATATLRNNIFVNRTANTVTASHYAIYLSSGTLANSNYNLFYITNLGDGYVAYNSGAYQYLDSWQNGYGFDLFSKLGNPFFANEATNDLRILTGSASPVNNSGTSVAWVSHDIEGTTRNASTPDIGAQEGNFVSGTPLIGTKTVGGVNPDYATFNDAMNALQIYGVGTGGVIFNVRPGTYNEIVTAYAATGASASNPIIFRRESGPVTVATVGTAASGDAGIRLIGADYYTFDGINVTDLGTTGSNYLDIGYWVTNLTGSNGATNNTIKNATITLNRVNTNAYAIYQNCWQTPLVQTGANNSNHYLNLKITNCRWGIYLNGNNSYRDQNTEIGSTTNNLSDTTRLTIGSGGTDDIGSTTSTYGIYTSYQETMRIHDCDIINLATTTSNGTVCGAYIANSYGVCEFSSNRIYNLRNASGDVNSVGSIYGIWLAPVYTGGSEVHCFNNTVSGLNHPRTAEGTTVYVHGIYVTSGTEYVDNNSILLNPSVYGHTNSCVTFSNCYLTLRNNVLANRTPNQSTAKHYGIYYSSATSYNSSNNLFYIPNTTTGYTGYYNSSDYGTLDSWQASTGRDANSLIGNPIYNNETSNDLRILSGASSPVNNAATPVAWITTDIEGTMRSLSAPDIGADEGNFVSSTPLMGTKTIGGIAPDYPTFSSALNALQLYGVGAGGVTFLVRPGVYSEQLIVNPIAGASLTNPVIFRKQSNGVTVTAVGTAASTDAAIKLVGCDWVTFDGIDVSDSLNSAGNSIEYGYMITNYTGTNGATNNVIENCTITLNRTNSSSRGVYQILSLTPTLQAGANNSNKFLNLRIGNCKYGMYFLGNSTYRDQNCEIGSSPIGLVSPTRTIIGFNGTDDIGGATTSYGIYVNNEEAIRIHDCDITNVFSNVNTQSAYGVSLNNMYGVSEISGNRITGIRNSSGDAAATGSVYGVSTASVTGANEIHVFNNFISNLTHPRTTESATVYVYGAAVTGIGYADNNTILLNPAIVGASNCDLYAVNATFTARNNILYNSTANQVTAKHYGIYCGSSVTLTSNYNLFQILNNGGAVGFYGGSQYTSLTSWRSSVGADPNSVAADPLLIDIPNNNLHIQLNVETPVSNAGMPVAWVTTDIDGDTRSNLPDIGADEGGFGLIVTNPVPANSATNVTTNAVLSWNAAQGATGYDVYFGTTPSPSIISSNQAGLTYTPVSGLLRNTLYYWKVIPRTAGGPGSGTTWSFTSGNGASPNSPDNGSISGILSNSLTVNWADNSSDEANFIIQYSTDGTTFSTLFTTSANTTSYQHTNIPPNTHYWYRVYATNANGNSLNYAEANGWTLVNAPQIPVTGTIGTLYVQLNLQNASTANPANTQYAMYESRTDKFVQADGSLGTNTVWRTLTDWVDVAVSGLVASAPYNFEVKARNGNNVESGYSPVLSVSTLPINEYFNTSTFPPLAWSVTNPDGNTTWGRFTGTNSGDGVAWLNFSNYFPGTDQQDILWTPAFSTLGAGNATVNFQWWYQSGFSANDGLEVLLTTDSGATTTSLWMRRGTGTPPTLGTGNGGTINYPSSSGWGIGSITLPYGMLGLPNLRVGFRSYNQYGPSLFLDSVQVTTTPIPRYAFNPQTFNFGNVNVGTTSQQSVYVVNRNPIPVQVTSASIGGIKFHYLSSIPITIPGLDSVLVPLTFLPDTTIAFRDTLRVQFTDGTPLTLPIVGTGYGSYASLSSNTLNFPNVIEPTRRDSLTTWIRVKGNAPLSNVSIVTLSGPFTGGPQPWIPVNAGDSGIVKLYFLPVGQGSYSGTVALISNAIHADTLRITLSGTAHYVPAAPGGLSIIHSGENANLSWAEVDTSLNGVQITVDRYLIYFRDNGTGPWYFLDFTAGASSTTYVHHGVVSYSPAMFYRVTAVVNTSGSDRIIRGLKRGMTESEVQHLLGTE